MKGILSVIKGHLRSAGLLENAEFYRDLSGLTTIGSGGKCLCFIRVRSRASLFKFLEKLAKDNIRFLIIGDGSNILFGDGLLELVVIKLEGEFDYMEFIHDDSLRAGTGYSLQKFVVKAAKNGFDFSFLGGIPGTVGGAVAGNSGTVQKGINSCLKSFDYIAIKGDKIENSHMEVKPASSRYRFLDIGSPAVITDVILSGDKSDPDKIFSDIRNKIRLKRKKQPVTTKNAGCFFKNPVSTELKAGELIEGCGLKGFCYGGAKISERHANYIENFSEATSGDIFILSRIIKAAVEKKYGIKLEYEVKLEGLNEK